MDEWGQFYPPVVSLVGRAVGISPGLDWVRSRADRDTVEKRQIYCSSQEGNLDSLLSSVVTIFTAVFGLPGFINKHFKSWRVE
jgi:hypothetical protein